MRPGRAARRADAANDLSDADRLADFHLDCREMCVARRKAIAVIDLDHLAVTAVPAGRRDGTGSSRAGGLAGIGADVDTGVHRRPAHEWVLTHPEAGGPFQFAGHRLLDSPRPPWGGAALAPLGRSR